MIDFYYSSTFDPETELKVKVWVTTGYANCSHKDEMFVNKNEWMKLSEEEKDQILDNAAASLLHNNIECGAYVDE